MNRELSFGDSVYFDASTIQLLAGVLKGLISMVV